MNTKKYFYGDESIEAPIDWTTEQVRTTWEQVYPALANANAIECEEGIRFETQAGTKG